MEKQQARSYKNNRDDKRLSFAICSIVIGLFFTNISEGVGELLNVSSTMISLASKVFILAMFCFCLPIFVRRFHISMIIWVIGTVTVILLNFFLFPETSKYFSETVQTFVLTVLPGMIAFISLEDYRICLKKLIVTSVIISILNGAVILLVGGAAFSTGYSMGYANAMVLPTNALIYYLLYQPKKKLVSLAVLLLIVANIIGVMVYGSRGALVAIAVCFVLLGYRIVKNKISIVIKLVGGIFLAICLVFYKSILMAIYNVLSAMGFSSRTLYLMATDLSHDSGRSELWNKLLTNIGEHPFAIRGINADFLAVNGYSHNFFLELIYAFGILIGVILSVFIIYHIIRTLKWRQDPLSSVKVLMLLSFFPTCLFSLSIWTSLYFWLWMVICLCEKKIHKKILNK